MGSFLMLECERGVVVHVLGNLRLNCLRFTQFGR